MEIPLLDLKAQYESLRDAIEPAVLQAMRSQQYINGPAVRELEAKVAATCGCAEGVGVSSGTDALLCSLMALEIGRGDEVITTPYTFFATAGSIWRTGARPVFVDIEYETFNMDVSQVEAAITPRTRAVMPVHLFGQCVDMDPLTALAKERGLAVIEDACQAIGATYKGKRAGSMGTTGCFSFYPTKNLNGIGDGGMVVTQEPDLAERLRAFRSHGGLKTYRHEWVGGNFRLDTLQAAALLVKLPHVDEWAGRRRSNAARYDELFSECEQVATPTVRAGNESVFNQYVIRVPKRDELREFLTQRGIGTGVYYPLSLHEQECFAELGYKRGDFPESERAAEESLALPIYPELTSDQIACVVDTVKEFYT